jgi:twitching motility protein PilJ
MNPFRNLKIIHQFLILLAILIGGFVALGLAYRQVLQVEHEGSTRVQRANELGDIANRIATDASAMDAAGKNLLLSKDLQQAQRFEDLLEQAQQEIDALGKVLPEKPVLDLVAQLRTGLASYDDVFDGLVNTRVLLGLTEDSGLEGEMRAAAQVVEDTLRKLDQAPLMASLLQRRRNEKNFILRESPKYIQQMHAEQAVFAGLLERATLPPQVRSSIEDEMSTYDKAFAALATATEKLKARGKELQGAQERLHGLLGSLLAQKNALIQRDLAQVASEREGITTFFIGAMIAVGGITAAFLLLLSQRMRRSLGRLQSTVQRVAAGDLSARSGLTTNDELGALSHAFDTLLNERVATLAQVERDNEALNESIIALMGAVARMSQKDLTVKAVVAADVTGAVSDAVNLMASETTKVLGRIRNLAQDVEQAAGIVRTQADKVSEVAAQERRLVQESAEELQKAGRTMSDLAQGAQGANDMAGVAMSHTREALDAVATTIGGIDQIRDIIRETEKRTKRLGERSQEITGAVNLINTIAERTHILALNASMHAASAGEAGRGFAVVADEVQRLAESSRKATSDIASMVNAIRVETADTLDTMNRLVTQAAEGTRLAQEAGRRMQETETTTAELVTAVQQMAEHAQQQARSVLELVTRSQGIVESTEQTSAELQEQSAHTLRLVDYANMLRESVAVFRLPAPAAQ